ncbi:MULTISPECIES: DUF3768 domain-containing protein [Hyphomicrobiales]|uniref:DUF3768 domain-containing protein n=1 Tax=Hyphomicrobiales TaxID=356 RepID=UPI0025BBA856|nr:MULTISPECIES: DUF3768 domain-containing protein [Hyphomicrobiales]MBX3559905.1 DUF3768 domain-containing protein [Chelatococcus sp.]MCO5154778.1 DUF3768 domain-containing protein [Shinella sp.]
MTARLTIAGLNDLLRTTFLTGRVMLTEGVRALPEATRQEVFTRVRTFTAFTPDNDPHGERDFGAIDVEGAGRVFWKIDYYDPSLTMGSEDPADPRVTVRVLTIMLAEEY